MIGILMLDTAFPRLLGDIGNPASFDHPVRFGVVPGATPEAIVCEDPRPWVDAFIAQSQALVADGCTALVTTCGFLTLLRADVERACGVPVVSSALELIPDLVAEGEVPGILTISAASLTEAHLEVAGVAKTVPIQGVDGGHFATAILGNQTELDAQKSERELVSGAVRLCEAYPETNVIVLECTNMPPHRAAIEAATGRTTVSIMTALANLHRAYVL